MPDSYLRFLSLAGAIRGLPSLPLLDPVEERLLNALAALWADSGEVTVLQAMRCAPGASPSTVQRRLKSLHEKGLVTYVDKPGDQRSKRIQPTPLANEYFAALSRCMNEAVRGR
jgi:DNA-binding MarR family transcriptional regulator